jgi:hypothetical protein
MSKRKITGYHVLRIGPSTDYADVIKSTQELITDGYEPQCAPVTTEHVFFQAWVKYEEEETDTGESCTQCVSHTEDGCAYGYNTDGPRLYPCLGFSLK